MVYTLSLRSLGGVSKPSSITIYPKDFTYKDKITSYLNEWNSDNDIVINNKTILSSQRSEVVYTDNLALVISLVNNMIDMVTAALIAFTCLSLVVSTVMIAIIAYVSVIERIKEIGVIRSLGGRKKDVSRLFNVETFSIGLGSGIIGVAFYLFAFFPREYHRKRYRWNSNDCDSKSINCLAHGFNFDCANGYCWTHPSENRCKERPS